MARLVYSIDHGGETAVHAEDAVVYQRRQAAATSTSVSLDRGDLPLVVVMLTYVSREGSTKTMAD